MNHTMLWSKCSNTDLQPCKHRHTQMKQTNRSRWQKQRHPLELNVFDAYENVHIQEKATKHARGLKSMQVKQTCKIKYFDMQAASKKCEMKSNNYQRQSGNAERSRQYFPGSILRRCQGVRSPPWSWHTITRGQQLGDNPKDNAKIKPQMAAR